MSDLNVIILSRLNFHIFLGRAEAYVPEVSQSVRLFVSVSDNCMEGGLETPICQTKV